MNLDKPHMWKMDIAQSVELYNRWFISFAPTTYRETRIRTTTQVENTLRATRNLTDVSPNLLRENPSVLSSLRMSTCPPLAVDRLIGLAGLSNNLVKSMEVGKLPPRMDEMSLTIELEKVAEIIERMADPDIFTWLRQGIEPTDQEIHRAATIVADRLCGAYANPIIRNAQEKRQLALMKKWLEDVGYQYITSRPGLTFDTIPPGTFSFRFNVPITQRNSIKSINIPIDVVVMPKSARIGQLPLLIEAKSAGDFANVNKRRKEEATKVNQLRETYGEANIQFVLLLCGYFDSGYLGYEASEGIDWIWEHRIDDLKGLGL